MFWTIYILSVSFFCYLILKDKETKLKNNNIIVFIVFILLLTPAQIQVGSEYFAPAIFAFFFNLIFEQDYSLRVLRPLSLSLIITLLGLWLFKFFKRRFF